MKRFSPVSSVWTGEKGPSMRCLTFFYKEIKDKLSKIRFMEYLIKSWCVKEDDLNKSRGVPQGSVLVCWWHHAVNQSLQFKSNWCWWFTTYYRISTGRVYEARHHELREKHQHLNEAFRFGFPLTWQIRTLSAAGCRTQEPRPKRGRGSGLQGPPGGRGKPCWCSLSVYGRQQRCDDHVEATAAPVPGRRQLGTPPPGIPAQPRPPSGWF